MANITDDTEPVSIAVMACGDYSTQVQCESHGCFWYNGACHSAAPACSDLNNSIDCSAYGCFWYDGACHSTPHPEGQADAINLIFNPIVEPGVPFEIDYDVTNNGNEDILWGALWDIVAQDFIVGTYWSEMFAAGETKHKIIAFPDGIQNPLNAEVHVGHMT